MAIKFYETANVSVGDGPQPVTTAVVGGISYVFVGNGISSDVSVLRLNASNGSLTNIGTYAGPSAISSMTISTMSTGQPLLNVTGYADDVLATFAINGATGQLVHTTGSPTPLGTGFRPNAVTSVAAGGQTFVYAGGDTVDSVRGFAISVTGGLVALPGNYSASATALAAANVGGTPYLFTAGRDDDLVRVFRVEANGALTATGAPVGDTATRQLDGAGSLATAAINGATFLFVGGIVDDGISVFRVNANGSLTDTDHVNDGESAALELDVVVSLKTAVISGKTYLFAAGQADDGVSIFSVSASGVLTNVGNIADAGARKLDGASGISIAKVGGVSYLFVTGLEDDGVSAFRLEDNSGNNIYVVDGPSDVVDEIGGGGTDLVRASINFSLSNTARVKGAVENLTLFGNALTATGNTLANAITANAKNNVLDGGANNDTLKGMAGNDTLIGGLGKDVMTGGTGSDTFKFASRTHSGLGVYADRIMDFDDGGTGDRIDVSALFGPKMVYRHAGAFTAAGQVRINDVAGLDVVVEVNTGGSLAPDFSIRLVKTTLASMNAGDFVL